MLLQGGDVKNEKKQNGPISLSGETVTISDNTITSSGAPGLSLEDMNYEVFRNKVDVTANQAWGIGAVETNGASGYMAVNMISGLGAHGIKAVGNNGLTTIYNSIMADINGGYVIYMQGGNNIVWRNILVNNNGNGRVVGTVSVTSVSLNMDENNLFTKGTEIGSYNGQVAATLASWQELSNQDGNSSHSDPGYNSTDLLLSRFDPTLLVYYPIPLDLTANQRNNFENQDWNGDVRENQGAYYFGVDNIQPEVIIDANPDEVIGCIGSTNMTFGVSAYVTLGAETQYQWYKDGMPIPGATETIYQLGALDYSMSGLYWCVVSGTGGATPIATEKAALYTLTEPEIDDHPQTAMTEVGGIATFNVSAHVRHLPPNWNYDYQWYFFDGTNTITLQDNDRIEGSRSSQLTIRKITSADFNTNTYYTARVIGKCGEVTSVQARIEEAVYEDYGLEITEQPMFASVVCPGEDIEINVEGQPLGTSTDLTYQWYKDGAALMDGDNVFGSASNSLRVAEATADDAGIYWVVLTELPGNNTLKSVEVPISFAPETVINDYTYPEMVEAGAMYEITWDVDGAEPLEVTLYLEGEIVNVSSEKVGTWVVAEADETNTGNFDIEVSAACGSPVLDIFAVILEEGGTPSSVPTALGINKLYDPMPNPVSNIANIYFEMKDPGSATLELMNQSGQTIATIVDGYRAAGLQNIEINADQLRLSSGMYYLVLRTGRYVGYSKLSIVK